MDKVDYHSKRSAEQNVNLKDRKRVHEDSIESKNKSSQHENCCVIESGW